MDQAIAADAELPAQSDSVPKDALSSFTKFAAPRVNICLWRRTLGTHLAALLDEAAVAGPFCLDQCAEPESIDLNELVAQISTIGERLRRQWVPDLHLLVALFAKATGARRVRVRLATVAVTQCPVFHSDYVGARLLCTYAGEGTQWLASRDVQRDQLGLGRRSAEQANRHIMRAGATIYQARRFDVVLCKGELWPGNSDNGLVHRSPSVPIGQSPRIKLTVDMEQEIAVGG